MFNREKMLKRIRAKYDENGIAGVYQSGLKRLRFLRGTERSDVQVYAPYLSALAWLGSLDTFSIVQIGAYIGDTENDPLCRFLRRELGPTNRERRGASSVVLVEPVPQYYEVLRNNYSDLRNVKFENVAIAETSGIRDLYRIAIEPTAHGLPEWLAQLGSLRADRMTTLWDKNEKDKELKKFLLANRITEKVHCITFNELVDRHKLQTIDFLQIDTEGYDYEIIRTIDFTRLTPRIINYERALLAESEPLCRDLLIKTGYLLLDWGDKRTDTIAIHVG